MGKRIKYKKVWVCFVVISIVFSIFPVMGGEMTETHELTEAKISISIQFDDIFYKGTTDGQVTVTINVLETQNMVQIYNLRVVLYEGVTFSGLRYTEFESTAWNIIGQSYTYTFSSSKSWAFTPKTEINTFTGIGCIDVSFDIKAYTETYWEPYRFYTEPPNTSIVIRDPEISTPLVTTEEITVTRTVTQKVVIDHTITQNVTETTTVTQENTETISETVTTTEKETTTENIEASFIPGFGVLATLVALPVLAWLRKRTR